MAIFEKSSIFSAQREKLCYSLYARVINLKNINFYNFMIENNLTEIQSQMKDMISTLNEIKEKAVQRVYDTKELSAYLKVGVSAIEKLRQDGELAYAKLGRTYVYTQADVDNLIRNNHVEFVA
jgi:excisionase family DNA binding protein